MDNFKISPIGIPKINNLIKDNYTTRRLKYLILFQMLVGINRLYLFMNGRFKIVLGYICTFLLAATTLSAIISSEMKNATYLVFRDTYIIEYTLLSFNSLFLYKKTFKKFFQKIESFDEILNIKNNAAITFSMKYLYILLFLLILCILVETVYFNVVETLVGEQIVSYAYLAMYIPIISHDTEIIFFCTLLVMVLKRVKIIKAHVAKIFLGKKSGSNQLEDLSYNANLSISELHNAYDLLHTCSEKLNSAMNFPMVLMFTSSGLSSIMLLKNVFRFLQIGTTDLFYLRALVIYTTHHCIKFTILVILPCYFSNITTTQVSGIRTMLHDAINTKVFEKYERRRLKAFFQLTRDNEFAYALWDVIKIDVSLPLSYCSLCVTYLIIVVQFSRFID